MFRKLLGPLAVADETPADFRRTRRHGVLLAWARAGFMRRRTRLLAFYIAAIEGRAPSDRLEWRAVSAPERHKRALCAHPGIGLLRVALGMHLCREQVSAPEHRLKYPLGIVADCVANVADARGNAVISDRVIGPDRSIDGITV
jgi:hypothetical protein